MKFKHLPVIAIVAVIGLSAPLEGYAGPTPSAVSVAKKSKKKSSARSTGRQSAYEGVTCGDFGYKPGIKNISAGPLAGLWVDFTFSKDGKLIKATYSQGMNEGKLSKSDVKDFAAQFAGGEIPSGNITETFY